MSHITSISLDPDSARLAQRMKREGKNFSKFVRECLHLYYREEGQECLEQNQISWKDCEPFCNPTASHYCRQCWPIGPPSREDMKAANIHVNQLNLARRKMGADTVKAENLIEGLFHYDSHSVLHMMLEPTVLEWLKEKAENHNAFIMPLADLDLEGNAKPTKAEKPRKGLLKRIFGWCFPS